MGPLARLAKAELALWGLGAVRTYRAKTPAFAMLRCGRRSGLFQHCPIGGAHAPNERESRPRTLPLLTVQVALKMEFSEFGFVGMEVFRHMGVAMHIERRFDDEIARHRVARAANVIAVIVVGLFCQGGEGTAVAF